MAEKKGRSDLILLGKRPNGRNGLAVGGEGSDQEDGDYEKFTTDGNSVTAGEGGGWGKKTRRSCGGENSDWADREGGHEENLSQGYSILQRFLLCERGGESSSVGKQAIEHPRLKRKREQGFEQEGEKWGKAFEMTERGKVRSFLKKAFLVSHRSLIHGGKRGTMHS